VEERVRGYAHSEGHSGGVKRTHLLWVVAGCLASWAAVAWAEPPLGRLRVACLMSGSFNWELAVIKREQLDLKHGFLLEKVLYAGLPAKNIALLGGEVDLIVNSWLMVAAQRARGVPIQAVYPYTCNVGFLVVPQHSPIQSLADLRGKRVGISSPVDGTWLTLRAACQSLYRFDPLAENIAISGSPPLLSGLLERGELDAILQFWQHVPMLLATGRFRSVASVADLVRLVGSSEPVPFDMYVSREDFLRDHQRLIRAYLRAAGEAREYIARTSTIWPELGRMMGIEDPAILSLLRAQYLEGLPRSWNAGSIQDLNDLLADLDRAECTQILGFRAIPPGTFSTAYFD